MDTELRASLVAAGAAAALSALVGLVSRVGFFVLAGRALIGGLLFGALVYGAVRLARSSLPGLGEGAPRYRARISATTWASPST